MLLSGRDPRGKQLLSAKAQVRWYNQLACAFVVNRDTLQRGIGSRVEMSAQSCKEAILVIVCLLIPLGALIPFLATKTAQAATSTTMTFQGRLLTSTGTTVPDGSYNMQFNLYTVSSGGSTQWTDSRLVNASQGITLKNGYFSVNLADTSVGGTAFPSTINWDQEQWLGLTVRGTNSCTPFSSCATPADAEMTPRFKLTAVPYAFSAGTALGVSSNNTSTASTASNNVTVQTGNATGATSNSGNLIIDTGTATQTTGTITLGATSASALTLGRSGLTTTNAGNLTVQGGTVTVGTTGLAGNLVVSDGSSNTGTILVASTSGDYTFTIPTVTANDTFCLLTLNNCSGLSASLTDNIANSWDIQEGTNNYININTTNTTENISFGNATTNPSYNFLGSGTLTVAGGLSAASTLTVSGAPFNPGDSGGSVDVSGNLLVEKTTANDIGSAFTSTLFIEDPTIDGQTYQGSFNVSSILSNANSVDLSTATISGSYGEAYSIAAGETIGSLRGISGLAGIGAAGGTVTNASALYANSAENIAGTITNSYGLYVENQTAATNDYGIYVAGADTYALFVDAGATRLDGTLAVNSLATLTAGLTITGATANINASSNFATNINTGTSTGAVSIGNSLAGVTTIQGAASATALQVLDAASAALFTVDTAARSGSGGNLLKVGNSTGTDTATTILQLDSATANPTTNLSALNGGLFYNSTTNKVNIIENGVVKVVCNATDASCGGNSTTLQQSYDADADGSDAIIAQTSTDGSLIFRNPSSGGSTSAYVLTVDQLATGAVGGLDVQSAGTGNLFRVRDTTATAADVLTIADGGATTFKNQTNSTSAFQLQNAAGSSLFNLDSTNSRITLTADVETSGSINSPYGGTGVIGNLLGCSQDFAETYCWTPSNVTVTANDGASNPAPDGKTTADKLVTSATSATVTYNNSSITGANTYTYSVWLKTNSGSEPLTLGIDSTSGTPATGTTVNVTATTTWTRYSVTQTFTGSPTNIRPVMTITNNSATVVAWGAQVQTGTSMGVYTPSGSASWQESGTVVNGLLRVYGDGNYDGIIFGSGDNNNSTALSSARLTVPGGVGTFDFYGSYSFRDSGTRALTVLSSAYGGGAGTLLVGESTNAVTQTAAVSGLSLDQSTNFTVPNSAAGNQTGISLTVKDGGASATAIGLAIQGTADTGISFGGTITNLINATNFNVAGTGAVTAVGVNAGAGLLQGQLGLTVTGAATNLNVSSNFGTNINTGTSTGAVAIGNSLAGVTTIQGAASATALQVLDAASAALFTVDTAARSGSGGNLLKVGNSTGTDTATTILQLDSATAVPTTNLSALNGGLFYNSTTNKVSIIENGVVKVVCNSTDASCGGNSTTLQQSYDADADGSDATIALTSTDGSLILSNPSSGGSTSAYILNINQQATGAVGGLDVQSAGTGNLFRVRDTTATAADVLTIADGGATTFRSQTNSTSAFRVQNAAGSDLLNIDTTGLVVNIASEAEFSSYIDSPYGGFGVVGTASAGNGNLLANTQSLDNGTWVRTNITSVTDGATAPNGNANADTIITTGSGTHTLVQTETNYMATGTYTFSVWLKSATSEAVQLRIDAAGGTIAPTTGTAASHTTSSAWKRYSVTQTFTGAGATSLKPTIVIPGHTATVVAWGAQLVTGSERGVYAVGSTIDTSIFPNTAIVAQGSIVLQDQWEKSGAISLYSLGGAENGMFVADVSGTSTGSGLEIFQFKGSGGVALRVRTGQYSVFEQGLQTTALLVGTNDFNLTASADLSFDSTANRTLNVNARTTAGAGRTLTISAGQSNGANAGGLLTLQGGAAAATSGAAGGAVTLTGAAGTSTSTGGNGGAVTISGGAGTSSGNRSGGAVSVTAGLSTGNATGGTLSVTSGRGGATGVGGALTVTSGAGGATSGNSGALTVSTGTTTSGATGALTISTGNATGGNSGAISVDTGTSGATTGTVTLAGANASSLILGRSGLTTTNAGNLTVQGASVTIGTASSTNGLLTLLNSTNAFGITLSASAQTVGSATISIPNTSGVADTFCLLTLANCAGGGLSASLTDNIANSWDIQQGADNYININTTNTTENISFGNATTNPSYSFLGGGNLTVSGNILGASSATGTTATTSGTGTNTTTLVFTATTSFANDDILFINNAGQDYYTRIVSGGTAASVTVSPAVSFDNAVTVTKYTAQNIGATATDYTTQTNRFFQGYFLGGVVTGAGSTSYSDRNITSSGDLNINATNIVFNGTLQAASSNNFALGTSDTTGTLLVLDTKTGSGDPTGVNGGMYYNSNAGKFRCYEATAWKDCDTTGAGSGVTTVGAIDTTPTAANGARISGTSIFMQYGDGSFPGLVSTTTQTFAGNKTFSGTITVANITPSVNLTVGTSDTTGTLLVLDTKTGSGDPTGVNGGMYYNSNAGKFRCYENGAWIDCIFGESIVKKTTSENSPQSLVTPQADDQLFFTMPVSATYEFEATIVMDVTNTTADYKYSFSGPTGVVISQAAFGPSSGTASTQCNDSSLLCGVAVTSLGQYVITARGTVTTDATHPGDFQFNFAQNTSTAAAAPTCKAGSILKYVRVL